MKVKELVGLDALFTAPPHPQAIVASPVTASCSAVAIESDWWDDDADCIPYSLTTGELIDPEALDLDAPRLSWLERESTLNDCVVRPVYRKDMLPAA